MINKMIKAMVSRTRHKQRNVQKIRRKNNERRFDFVICANVGKGWTVWEGIIWIIDGRANDSIDDRCPRSSWSWSNWIRFFPESIRFVDMEFLLGSCAFRLEWNRGTAVAALVIAEWLNEREKRFGDSRTNELIVIHSCGETFFFILKK